MIVIAKDVMCVSVPNPIPWNMDGREGVTYKVDLSDGLSTVQIQCDSVETYSAFVPFKKYSVELNLVQTNFDGRKGVKAQVCNAVPKNEK